MASLESAPPGMAVGITIHRGCWATNTPTVITKYDEHMAKMGLTQGEYQKIVDALNTEYEELVPEYYAATMWCCMITLIGGPIMQECVIMGQQKKVEEYTKEYINQLNQDPLFKDRFVFRLTGLKSDYGTRKGRGVFAHGFDGDVLIIDSPMDVCDGVIEVWAKEQLPSSRAAPVAMGVPLPPAQVGMVVTSSPVAKQKNFCTSCGSSRDPPGAPFCGACGAKFE